MALIARVRAVSQGWPGGPGLNTFYFKPDDPLTDFDQASAQLCHDRVHAGFLAAAGIYCQDWNVLVGTVVDVLNDVNGDLMASFGVTQSAAVVGAGGLDFGPLSIGLLLRLNTSDISDGSRIGGRAFLTPLDAGANSDGTPAAGYLAFGLAMGTALLDDGISGPDLVVWRRPRLAVPEATPPVTARDGSSHVVTSTSVPDTFVVLRSRRD